MYTDPLLENENVEESSSSAPLPTSKLSHEEIKEKTWPGQSGFGGGSKTVLRGILPLYLMAAGLLGGGSLPGLGSTGTCRAERRTKRKCALPECNVQFTPSRDSACCCTGEHFKILRERQKSHKT